MPVGFLESEFERALAVRGGAATAENVVPMGEPQLAQAALRERARRFRELLDALPAAIYTTDAAGRITYYNEPPPSSGATGRRSAPANGAAPGNCSGPTAGRCGTTNARWRSR